MVGFCHGGNMPANHDADNYDDGDNDDYDDDGDADAADALLWNAVDPRKPLDLRARSLYLYSSDEDNHHQDLLCSVYYCRSTYFLCALHADWSGQSQI